MNEHVVSTEAAFGREYEKGDKTFHVWRIGLQDARSDAPDGLFELHKVKGNAPPKPGEKITVKDTRADTYEGVPFTRLYLDSGYRPGQNGGGGAGKGGGGKDFERRPEHPRNEARFIHTSCLSSAPAFIDQMLTLNIQKTPGSWDEYFELVGRVVNKLRGSYQGPLERVSPPPATPPVQFPQQEVPADTEGLPGTNGEPPTPESVASAADDDIPF